MQLSNDCLKSMCTIAIGATALASGFAGVSIAAGAMEIMTASGHLALDLRKEQQKEFDALERQVRKKVERDYKVWLRHECGNDWAKRADVNAALAQLDDALHRTRPTVADMVNAAHNPVLLVDTLIERLPESSLYRSEQVASGVFAAIITGLHGLARTDEKLKPLFDTLSWQKALTALEELKDGQTNIRAEISELKRELHTKHGIPIENLEKLFVAAQHQFPNGDYVAAVNRAVEAIIARDNEPVNVGNLGDDLQKLIEEARHAFRQTADVQQATESFDEIFQNTEGQMLRAAALAAEKAGMFAAVFRFDDAIRHFELAARYNPDDAWPRFEVGDIRLSRGNLSAALAEYEEGKAVAERTGNERDLSVSHNKIGDMEVARGDAESALAAYQAGLVIAEKLAAQDPTNTEWQRDLSVSHNKIGDMEVARGDAESALAAYQAGLAIAEKLAAQDPTNTQWQRDLSVSHERIGDVEVERGDGDAALAAYQASLAIREKLAAQGSTNAGRQRDLSISHNKIGDVERARGNTEAALASYQAGLVIADKLAAQDPTNTEWQRDLSVSHNKIGDMEVARGNSEAAFAAYQAGLAISEKLAGQDPTNSGWQYDLFVSYWRMADMEPDPSKQIKHLTAGLERLEALHAENRLLPIHVEWIEKTKDRINSIRDE
ncbi:MAG: hypothetical protein AAFP80_02395 [Pseudomonadota bacterium]